MKRPFYGREIQSGSLYVISRHTLAKSYTSKSTKRAQKARRSLRVYKNGYYKAGRNNDMVT